MVRDSSSVVFRDRTQPERPGLNQSFPCYWLNLRFHTPINKAWRWQNYQHFAPLLGPWAFWLPPASSAHPGSKILGRSDRLPVPNALFHPRKAKPKALVLTA
jgi:hypothetical protein